MEEDSPRQKPEDGLDKTAARRNGHFAPSHVWTTIGFLLGVAIIYCESASFTRISQSLSAPVMYWKDCISPYLMAKATWHGVNPYLPLPQLANVWLKSANPANHPTPYPPFVALISLPFASLRYEILVRAWLCFELACVTTTIILLLRWAGRSLNPLKIALYLGLSIIWMPLNEELWQGQFMSLLALMLVGAWLYLRSGREIFGGILVGGLIAIKMMGVPILLFLVLRRRWRSFGAAVTLIFSANLLAMFALGTRVVLSYYTRVGPFDSKLWRPAEGNFSAWAWGIRLFEGAGFGYHLHPLFVSPQLTLLATYLLPLVLLIVDLVLAGRATNFDTAFSWLAGTTILFSPIAWYFYFLLAVIPIVVLARRLIEHRFPAEVSVLALFSFVLLSVKPAFYDHLALSYGTMFNAEYHMLGVPFAAGLFALIPLVGLFGILWLVWRTDRAPAPN